jgi:hypothetical protein
MVLEMQPWSAKAGFKRERLTKEEVINIFKIRYEPAKETKMHSSSAASLAKHYTVSEKAIRDIWRRRTWASETAHLHPVVQHTKVTAGRPKGSVDKKVRKSRLMKTDRPINTLSIDTQLGMWACNYDMLTMLKDPFINDWKLALYVIKCNSLISLPSK